MNSTEPEARLISPDLLSVLGAIAGRAIRVTTEPALPAQEF